MTVDLAPFGRWIMRDKAAQRQSFFELRKKGCQLPEEIGKLKICTLDGRVRENNAPLSSL